MTVRRLALIGAGGQLSTDLMARFEPDYTIIPLTHVDLEICDHQRVRTVLTSIVPDLVINTAAFHKVDACERDIPRALAVNCHAVRNLALVCNDLGARLVHFSTDYVFGGGQIKPFREDDPPNPLNVYGVSKVLGEHFVRCLSDNYLLIRTSGLYGLKGSSAKGSNFVETMLRLGREKGAVTVVGDQVLSPTYTVDLAHMTHQLVKMGARGLFHVTNGGWCSWYQFALAIFDFAGMPVAVHETTTAALGSSVRRPGYSALDNRQLREERFEVLRPWRDALQEYLTERANRMASAA